MKLTFSLTSKISENRRLIFNNQYVFKNTNMFFNIRIHKTIILDFPNKMLYLVLKKSIKIQKVIIIARDFISCYKKNLNILSGIKINAFILFLRVACILFHIIRKFVIIIASKFIV